ncbi:uncharacterized protein C16orf78 homolog isoform X3 [Rhinolophus ferrumequinum]|uniref:uncharacterized protein C16orf78 homolog isoform X3 n=1 Tax=Rhinolophus ferrumequinum TaxID=59479 RepID=UPI00140FEF70|nr:uncharacterized protein C16orf78 homolog isoform X3 [Rhinolophus ferrumequinum]XP_032984124.1 uncharacterized protein C16orf78 homolog isoform X3 [Rhinolophus ferrumequinum]XP_032984125.1 uncharacterized protein C16orf78 homolog isoform X3 [Rhinolophus ferrumequinum]XP_032984126.1 uncharacterized protein C16orf78 homolog isoform X3 [Rhinolophus ferrumequinum]XP_032984128.1 uncharacterized protein C16orf78 homolog isoform X3 [Rhinolophus ferrumequinum]
MDRAEAEEAEGSCPGTVTTSFASVSPSNPWAHHLWEIKPLLGMSSLLQRAPPDLYSPGPEKNGWKVALGMTRPTFLKRFLCARPCAQHYNELSLSCSQQGHKKHKAKVAVPPKATGKEEKKARNIQKQQSGKRRVMFSEQVSVPKTRRDEDAVHYRRLYGVEPRGRRLSMVPGNYLKHGPEKSDLEIKDGTGADSIRRSVSFRRQSIIDPMLQDTLFAGRRSTLLKDWVGKTPDSYERKMKSLMEKGTEPKIEIVKMLKPEEVLSCRYLRLSHNNIRTLLKLCRDAGLDVDIHPHMIEGEIDAKKVFARDPTVAL